MNSLIGIDYFSNWLEIIRLEGKVAHHLIIKLKEIFVWNGLLELCSYNRPPFGSVESFQRHEITSHYFQSWVTPIQQISGKRSRILEKHTRRHMYLSLAVGLPVHSNKVSRNITLTSYDE